jgi:hypothetical protein
MRHNRKTGPRLRLFLEGADLSLSNALSGEPTVYLRSFFGFGPEEEGYIGWTEERQRARMLGMIRPGDLFLIYGAGAAQTPKAQQRQVLGVLQVDVEPIRDVDKASAEGMQSKARNGWGGKWSYAIPVRRAWRSTKAIPIDYVAKETYDPNAGQAIATWSRRLTEADVARVMKLEVVEVPVFGEPPLANPTPIKAPLSNSFKPSRGLVPTFGNFALTKTDGEHRLYVVEMKGQIAAVLGRHAGSIHKKRLVKVGFSNDLVRRCVELNAGLPPAAQVRWEPWLANTLPNGANAKSCEDRLKAALNLHTESLGKEFFLGDEIAIQIEFAKIFQK